MTITVSDSFTRPALTYDKLHVNSYALKVDQTTFKYIVNGVSTVYGLDDTGTKVFSDRKLLLDSTDFEPEIVGYIITKGEAPDPQTAIAQIQKAKIDVTNEYNSGSLTTAKIMAYFELALGLQFEIAKQTTIQSLE